MANHILNDNEYQLFLKMAKSFSTGSSSTVIPNNPTFPYASPNRNLFVKITSIVSSQGGRYNGKLITPNLGSINNIASTNLAGADFGGVSTAENCIVWNTIETGATSHAINPSDNTQCYVWGNQIGVNAADGKPIIAISQTPKPKAFTLLANVAADESLAITNGTGTHSIFFTSSNFTIADGDLSGDGVMLRITAQGTWVPTLANSEILFGIYTQSGHSVILPGPRLNWGAATSSRTWDLLMEVSLGATHTGTAYNGKYWSRSMGYSSSGAPIADFNSGTTNSFLLPGNGNLDLTMQCTCTAQFGTVKLVAFNVVVINPKS